MSFLIRNINRGLNPVLHSSPTRVILPQKISFQISEIQLRTLITGKSEKLNANQNRKYFAYGVLSGIAITVALDFFKPTEDDGRFCYCVKEPRT